MVENSVIVSLALREAIEKLGKASMATDIANDIAGPAIKQLETAHTAIATAAALLQDAVRSLALVKL